MISKSNPESNVSSKTKRRQKIDHPIVEFKTLNKVVRYLVTLVSQEGLDISSKRRLMKELREALRRCHPLVIKKLMHFKSTRKSQEELENDIPKWHLAGSHKLLSLLPFSTQKTVDSRAKKGLHVETPRRKIEAVRTRPSANRETTRKEKIRPRLGESTDRNVEFLKTIMQRAPIKLCPGKAKKRGSVDTKGPSRKTATVKREREIFGKKSSSPPLSVFAAQDQKKKSLFNSESRRGILLGTDEGNLTDDSEPSSEIVFQYSSKLRSSSNYEIFGSLETPYLPLEWQLRGINQKSKKKRSISTETTPSAKLAAKKRKEILTLREPKTDHVSSTTVSRLFRPAASVSTLEKVSLPCDEAVAPPKGDATKCTASTRGQTAMFSGTHTRGQTARFSSTHTASVTVSAGDTMSPVTTGFKDSFKEGFQMESSQKVGFLRRGTVSKCRKAVPAIRRKHDGKLSRGRKEEKSSTTETRHQSPRGGLICEFCKPGRPVFRDEQELMVHKKTLHRFACCKCKIEFTDSLKSFLHWKINHVTKFQLGENEKTGVPPRYVTLETERTAKDLAALNLQQPRKVPCAVLEKPGGSADRGCSCADDKILITENVVMSHITANKGAIATTTVEFAPKTGEVEIPSGPVEDLQEALEEVLRDEGFHGSDASMEDIEMDVAASSKSKTTETGGINLGKVNPQNEGDELGNILEGVLEFLEESSYPFLALTQRSSDGGSTALF